jgi:hypothetical protein
MKLTRPHFVLPLMLLMAVLPLLAQRNERDPLNPKEVDELRDTNQEPEKRLPLIVRFARERLDAALAARGNPKLSAADRTATIHSSVQDFLSIYDELGDNLDMYTDQKEDLRKPLKVVVAGDGEFKVKLDQLHPGGQRRRLRTPPTPARRGSHRQREKEEPPLGFRAPALAYSKAGYQLLTTDSRLFPC